MVPSLSRLPSLPACAVRGLLAGRVPPEGPWELQGIELLSQNELYRQILLLLHLLPQDLLLPQVRPPAPRALGPVLMTSCGRGPGLQLSGQESASPPPPPGTLSEGRWCFSSRSPASLPTAPVRRCWTGSSSVGSWLLRRYAPPKCQCPGCSSGPAHGSLSPLLWAYLCHASLHVWL